MKSKTIFRKKLVNALVAERRELIKTLEVSRRKLEAVMQLLDQASREGVAIPEDGVTHLEIRRSLSVGRIRVQHRFKAGWQERVVAAIKNDGPLNQMAIRDLISDESHWFDPIAKCKANGIPLIAVGFAERINRRGRPPKLYSLPASWEYQQSKQS